MLKGLATGVLSLSLLVPAALAQQAPQGEIKGTALVHTPASLAGLVAQANVALPTAATGGAAWFGKWKDMPATKGSRVPVILFLHGSSGLGLKAIEEWQVWLAGLGYASVAPDSFALPDRVTYKSPVAKDFYEKLHALRASEIAPTLQAVKRAAWANPTALVLAGTSEGSVPVARYDGSEVAARLIYSWSCETNYFVEADKTAVGDKPMLNIISSVDPYFSASNGWLGNSTPKGHCATAFAGSKSAEIVLIPGAPHTLLNLPQARRATRSFLQDELAK